MKIYEYVIRIKDQATDKLGRLASGTRNTASRLVDVERGFGRAHTAGVAFGNAGTASVNKLNNNLNRSRTGFLRFRQSVNESTNSMNMFGGAASMLTRWLGPIALGAALTAGTMKASALGRELEQTQISFEVLLGNARQGRELLSKTIEMGVVTPFTSRELQSSAKLLLGYGTSAQKIIPTLKMLGDISGGNADRLHLLSLAYAQSQAAGRLMGQDLLQMVNSGFNPLQVISEKTGISIGKLKKQMEEGAISAKMVEAAFRAATQEGGRFYNMMERQSQTFEGRLSTLRDKFEIWLTKIGTSLNEKLAPYLDKAIEIIDRWIDPVGALQSATDKQTSQFHKLVTSIKPAVDRYRELAQAQKLSTSEQKEMLALQDKIGNSINIAAKKEGGKTVGIDTDAADSFINRQKVAFENSNKYAIASLEAEQKRVSRMVDEFDSEYSKIQEDKGGAYRDGLDELRMKYMDMRSGWEVMKETFGFGPKEEEYLTKIKNALATGDSESILAAYAEQMNKLNEEALRYSQRLDKLKQDQKAVYEADKKEPGEDWKKMGDDIMGGKSKTDDGTDKITGGGKQSINVTINVERLNGIENVDAVNGQMDINSLMRMMEKMAAEAMVRVVNSGNYAAQQ